MVAGKRGDIAAGGRQTVDHHDQRFLLPHPPQRVEQLLRTGSCAARTANMDIHPSTKTGPSQWTEWCGAILVASDQARNGPPRDVRAHAETIIAVAGQHGRAGNAKHDEDDRRDPPEAELPPHPAAIDDE